MARDHRLVLTAMTASLAVALAAPLGQQASEEAAVELLHAPGFDISSLKPEDVDSLIQRGWHDTVRALIVLSHKGGEADAQLVASHVRAAVTTARNRLDDLIRVLDRNYGKAVEVTPSAQWAQNSTHVFMQVKFAQRWNAPGALEVFNETMDVTPCCLNFTAYGEHSFILRRYSLSLHFLQPVLPDGSSWHFAAAGRMTVTVAKAQPANWAMLLHESLATPKNLGRWRDMQEKWKNDLEKFVPIGQKKKEEASPAKEKKSHKKAAKKSKPDEDDEEALDREVDLISECDKSAFSGSSVNELCEKAWKVVSKPELPRKWLIIFYSGEGVADKKLHGMLPVWKRLGEVLPSTERTARVGAVDCQGDNKQLCRKLGATLEKLPLARRFIGGGEEGDAWAGGVDELEGLMDFGAGKTTDNTEL